MELGQAWKEKIDREVVRLNAGPEESAVYAAKVALTKLLDRDGLSCPPAAVAEALAALVAERAAERDEIEAHAEIVVDLENIAAKWRGKVSPPKAMKRAADEAFDKFRKHAGDSEAIRFAADLLCEFQDGSGSSRDKRLGDAFHDLLEIAREIEDGESDAA